ncbi:hypothetical protein FACS189421_06210 [Bacteroidia bacterium]|nr:hypothetical protein FACS189421_06210 [Bacteroidia bacterium]
MQEEENNMELRSEEFQEVLGDTPPWILRGGITLLAIVVLVLLAGSAVFKYPDILAHHYLNRFSLKQSLYHR